MRLFPEGCRPLKESSHGVYTSLEGMPLSTEGCRPFRQSSHRVYTSERLVLVCLKPGIVGI